MEILLVGRGCALTACLYCGGQVLRFTDGRACLQCCRSPDPPPEPVPLTRDAPRRKVRVR